MVTYYPFRPALQGMFLERFHTRVREVCQSEAPREAVDHVAAEEYRWATSEARVNPGQRRIYRAIWLLLRDLLRARWTCRWHEATVELAPPEPSRKARCSAELMEGKEALRAVMGQARRERLSEARDFLERMERPPANALARTPISSLIGDGAAIAARLRPLLDDVNELSQLATLREAVRPYLQLVTENARCAFTGHKLSDIWRYFRFTWATPAENTPGRTLLYLVRDAAQPVHPIMGIASYENSALRITGRDAHLGWTTDSVAEEIAAGNLEQGRATVRRLVGHIQSALEDLRYDDLCSKDELDRPNKRVLTRLSHIAERSGRERHSALRAWWDRDETEGAEDEAAERSELGNISLAAEEALYRRKRAEQLGRLLLARQTLLELLGAPDFEDRCPGFLRSERGNSAVWTALVALKNRHIGTSILELNVCGAVPPYNDLLAGKLAALLMLSPQVVRDYRARYGRRASDIASRLKGEPVVRPAELVFAATTSLYSVGSSQYNRLKLPAGLLRIGAPEVRWRLLGQTTGYGTLHIGRLTVQCLEEATREGGYPHVTHAFGEGFSPKLRVIRDALDNLFEPGQRAATEEMGKHAMSRLVYGAWLASNGRAYLNGEADSPEYYFDAGQPAEEATERIAEYWRRRWLLKRLGHAGLLEKLADFDAASLQVSRDLRDDGDLPFAPIPEESAPAMSDPTSDFDSRRDFLRSLYRGPAAYADGADPALLDDIHVETRIEDAVVRTLASGRSVVLTGNPGDGKTHLLRILQPRLAELPSSPDVELDASRLRDTELYARWAANAAAGRPFCLAVNEAVLFGLAAAYPHFAPLQEARRQVETAVRYATAADAEPDRGTEPESVVVFDLSLRDVLSADIVSAVIERLTAPTFAPACQRCPQEGCDFTHHRALLRSEQVRRRLQLVLERLSRRGYHATLREVEGLIAYLLFGNRGCDELMRHSGARDQSLPTLVYSGTGRLFDLLRASFDPARTTHPRWDDELVHGLTSQADWLPGWPAEADALDPGNWARFEARKRAFYFCHRAGEDLLALASDDETMFGAFLESPSREALHLLIRRINRFFGLSASRDELRVWQSHRYNQAPPRILYSCGVKGRRDFEIAYPRLSAQMGEAFDLARDHLVLRLRAKPEVSLRVDFLIFRLLAQAERGVPALALDDGGSRRLWHFMEALSEPVPAEDYDEVPIVLFDPVSGEHLTVEVDAEAPRYLSIARREQTDADTD